MQRNTPQLQLPEAPHRLTSPHQRPKEGKVALERERRGGSCHLIQVTRRPVRLAGATDEGAVERRPCPQAIDRPTPMARGTGPRSQHSRRTPIISQSLRSTTMQPKTRR